MKPTNYSHESHLSGEVLEMHLRLQTINTVTDGGHKASLSEYPDLFAQPTFESLSAQPEQPAADLRLQPDQRAAATHIPPAVITPPIERPRTASAGNLIALTEQDQLLASARAAVNREAS
jgi:hypothetical protein